MTVQTQKLTQLKPVYPGQHLVSMVRDPLELLTHAAPLGDLVRLQIGSPASYLVTHPDLIRDVLVTNHRSYHKSPVMRRMTALLGQGLLSSEDELHMRQRRLIQPAFHRQRIAEYAQVMTRATAEMSATWQPGQVRDIHGEMMHLTMIIVGQALFGVNVADEASEIGEAITTLLHGSRRLLLPFWETIQRLPLKSNREVSEAGLLLDQTIRQMINERRKLEAEGKQGDLHHDLLDMLLSARDNEEGAALCGRMSDKLVRDEALTLFLAGHETTANALTWTFYLLSQHPQVEARLQAEVDAVLAGRTPTAADLERLPYTRQVLSESMRLYPPAWLISRQAVTGVQLGDHALPAGSILLLSQYVTHHDPRYYTDPERFDPDRWTPEAAAARPKFAYFPFGGGPRLCIGEPFAWMEGTLVLAMLTQQWRLRLVPGHPIALLPQVTLRPKYGMKMTVDGR